MVHNYTTPCRITGWRGGARAAAAGSAQPNALGVHLAERPDSADGSLASTASTAAAAAPALLASSEDDDCLFPD